jgi:hypothetical protein
MKSPAQHDVERFMQTSLSKLSLPDECLVVTLIYVERLMKEGSMKLSRFNWRPVVYTALLLSSKTWEDLNCYNVDFHIAYPHYSLHSICQMEHLFTEMINWKLYISPELYSQYYYTLKDEQLAESDLPPPSPPTAFKRRDFSAPEE